MSVATAYTTELVREEITGPSRSTLHESVVKKLTIHNSIAVTHEERWDIIKPNIGRRINTNVHTNAPSQFIVILDPTLVTLAISIAANVTIKIDNTVISCFKKRAIFITCRL